MKKFDSKKEPNYEVSFFSLRIIGRRVKQGGNQNGKNKYFSNPIAHPGV